MINLAIILHEKTFLKTQVDQLVFISEEGEYGILPYHAPVILVARNGYLRLSSLQKVIYFTDGILKFVNNNAILLASIATSGRDKKDAFLAYEQVCASMKKESEIELVDFSKLEKDLRDNIKKGRPAQL